jgi:DNA-binding LytR/AlgR family response regulator
MNTLSCIIVDDEPIALSLLQAYIRREPKLNLLDSCSDIEQLKVSLLKHKPDLLILDIRMPGTSGMDFLKSLKPPPVAIFTTAYREFALEAFDAHALDYLTKPFSFDRFQMAVQKAEQFINGQPEHQMERCIFVKSDGQNVKVQFSSIRFIEALGEYIKIVLTEGRPLVVYTSMQSMMDVLPNDEFVRIHRSYIMHLRYVEAIDGNKLKTGNQLLPISRKEKNGLSEMIAKLKVAR